MHDDDDDDRMHIRAGALSTLTISLMGQDMMTLQLLTNRGTAAERSYGRAPSLSATRGCSS